MKRIFYLAASIEKNHKKKFILGFFVDFFSGCFVGSLDF